MMGKQPNKRAASQSVERKSKRAWVSVEEWQRNKHFDYQFKKIKL